MISQQIRSGRSTPLAAVAAAAVIVGASLDASAQPAAQPEVLAVINGVPITADDLHPMLRTQLRDLEHQAYELKRRAVDEILTYRLLTLEANRIGYTIEQLLSERVDRFVADPTPEDVDRFIEENKDDVPPIPLDELKLSVEMHLRNQRRDVLVRRLIEKLQAEYDVAVHLTPLRFGVRADGPVRGPETAAVTIVTFSDFQCATCAHVQPTLARLFEEYPGQIRLIFRHFPLQEVHPRAHAAAVAAVCADAQNRFWDYHDRLFRHQDELGPDDLVTHAADLGLNTASFAACVNGQSALTKVARDLEDGHQTGVTATPTFFVNGRPLLGSVPYEAFQEIVQDEVRRLTSSLGGPPPGVVPPARPPGSR
jgi:protein-disulfide isomerase